MCEFVLFFPVRAPNRVSFSAIRESHDSCREETFLSIQIKPSHRIDIETLLLLPGAAGLTDWAAAGEAASLSIVWILSSAL